MRPPAARLSAASLRLDPRVRMLELSLRTHTLSYVEGMACAALFSPRPSEARQPFSANPRPQIRRGRQRIVVSASQSQEGATGNAAAASPACRRRSAFSGVSSPQPAVAQVLARHGTVQSIPPPTGTANPEQQPSPVVVGAIMGFQASPPGTRRRSRSATFQQPHPRFPAPPVCRQRP